MRILKRKIFHGQGFVHLKADEEDDLWFLYNLIQPGDNIRTLTCRKVKFVSKTGSVSSDIKTFMMTLQVEKVDYLDNEDMIQLEIKGRSVVENQYMNLGQYHTFKIDMQQALSIFKTMWDQVHYKILDESVEQTSQSEIKVLIMEEGIAHLCFQRQNTFRVRKKIELSIPKKRMDGCDSHNKKIQKFYEQCFNVLFGYDLSDTKCIIVASPGFVKDQFKTYCQDMVLKEEHRHLKNILQKFILVHSANGYVNCLTDILQQPAIQKQLENTKALDEVKLFEKFQKTLEKEEDKIQYTPKYVLEASQHKAIKHLMITDTLFRTRNFAQRKVYNDLCEEVKAQGGSVNIFSGKLYTGEKLDQLGGVAAILNFPLNLDYLDEKEEIEQEPEKEQDFMFPEQQNDMFEDFCDM